MQVGKPETLGSSSRRSSLTLSHGGPNPVSEASLSSDVVVRAGENADRANEMAGGVSRQDSTGQMSATGSSRRSSIKLTRELSDRILESIRPSRDSASEIPGDVYSSIIAQTGDRGDRVVVDGEEGGTNAVMQSLEENQMQTTPSSSVKLKLPRTLDYISYMIHLAVFGNLGVFTRYLLQKLFGPSHLALTADQTPLYLDLPANMLGSFLMGWFGVVFKADIRDRLSDQIVVGITTGYLGSLTTFSGWNQKMLSLSSKGHWVFAVAGIILGMMIVNESIRIGVESAEVLRRILVNRCVQDHGRIRCLLQCLRVDTRARHISVMLIMLLVLITLLGLSGSLARMKLDNVSNSAILWLGCMVGPPGVWARWYLARLNGRGMGSKGQLKWLPIGTLLANVIAAFLMAALATIGKAVNTKRCDIIIGGIQFGFLGCLSTVSTFVAEVYAMRQSGDIWRAAAYTAITILFSFAFGTLIYSVPVWVKHYQ